MTQLSQSFQKIKPFKALVLGDFLLDTYTFGKVKRISPEAPVPVLEVLRHDVKPGGAGNVVLNLQALGATVYCVGRVGDDANAKKLKNLLNSPTINLDCLVVEKGYITAEKNRLIADSQQLLRIDHEVVDELSQELEAFVIERVQLLIPQVDVVAISDYAKGFLTKSLLATVIAMAKKDKKPVVVDPKGTDFSKYLGATIIKPNLSEAYAAVKMPLITSLDVVARELLKSCAVDLLFITRSEAGISLFTPSGQRQDFPVLSKEVIDVTGAGDTVLAVLCLGIASGFDFATCAELANIAAGIAIERLGCHIVTLYEISQRLLKLGSTSKVFDDSQFLDCLHSLQDRNYRVLVLSNKQPLNVNFFKTLRSYAKNSNEELVVYLQEGKKDEDFISFLSHLSEVDSIILKDESLKKLCQKITPKEVLCFEGGVVKKLKDFTQLF